MNRTGMSRIAILFSTLALVFTAACSSAEGDDGSSSTQPESLTLRMSRTYVTAPVPVNMKAFQTDCANCGGRLMKQCDLDSSGRIVWDSCRWQCVGGYGCALGYGQKAD